MNVSLSSLTDYYANLLAYQYRNQPRAFAQTRLLAKQAVADLFPLQVQDAFNVSTAIGAQLDVIGKYVGVSRLIGVPTVQPYFGFWDNTITDPVQQNVNGFTDSTNPTANAQGVFFQSYFVGNENTALSDEAYRLVIQLQIILNQNDSSLAQIQLYLHDLLPGLASVEDNEDMSLTYTVSTAIPVPAEVLRYFLPKPAGVGLTLLIFSVSVSPTSYTHTFHVAAPNSVTSAAFTATPTNGEGPYEYSWVRLSETRPDFPDTGTVADSPTSASTTFTHYFGALATSVSTWVCYVNDAHGLTAQTAVVTVTMTIDGPP